MSRFPNIHISLLPESARAVFWMLAEQYVYKNVMFTEIGIISASFRETKETIS